MKSRFFTILTGVLIAGVIFPPLIFPGSIEGRETIPAEGNSSTERPLSADRPEEMSLAPIRHDGPFWFDRKTGGRMTTPEREAEAIRFHQNSILDQFQNTDAHGSVFLSFSRNRISVKLRSITGAEAPVADILVSPKK
ncbi:MAG: hypothetical protein WAO55_11870 [Candidatus Manganitrophaceae bacterium]